MAEASDLPIVLYHYVHSPYAWRIVAYLTLRQIPYTQCFQPNVLPRPDLKEKLGIAYRRIPVLAIGRDVYLDTRLMIAKLERLFPASAAHPGIGGAATRPEHRLVEALLSRVATDGGLFTRAVQLLPPQLVAARGSAFVRDRADLAGVDLAGAGDAKSPFSAERLAAARPEAAVEVRQVVELLETTALADGRDWLLGAPGPTLADLEAVWVLLWLYRIPGALPADVLSKALFPKVFSWVERFERVTEEKRAQFGDPETVEGDVAASMIVRAPYVEAEGDIDATDPVITAEGLEKGANVKLWPTDWGFLHKDSGMLVSMDMTEFVIETAGTAGSIRVHAPRHGFKICKTGGDGARL
ncbi:glutathione S-transferase [Hypoxylon cercidicola]|nr:glutathione S-transferase [Hypoxylon cercidicola]